jgi:hypothetical protein
MLRRISDEEWTLPRRPVGLLLEPTGREYSRQRRECRAFRSRLRQIKAISRSSSFLIFKRPGYRRAERPLGRVRCLRCEPPCPHWSPSDPPLPRTPDVRIPAQRRPARCECRAGGRVACLHGVCFRRMASFLPQAVPSIIVFERCNFRSYRPTRLEDEACWILSLRICFISCRLWTKVASRRPVEPCVFRNPRSVSRRRTAPRCRASTGRARTSRPPGSPTLPFAPAGFRESASGTVPPGRQSAARDTRSLPRRSSAARSDSRCDSLGQTPHRAHSSCGQ